MDTVSKFRLRKVQTTDTSLLECDIMVEDCLIERRAVLEIDPFKLK